MEMRGTPAQDPLMSIHDVMATGLAGVKPVGSVDLSMPIYSELFLELVAESQTPDRGPSVCFSQENRWSSPSSVRITSAPMRGSARLRLHA